MDASIACWYGPVANAPVKTVDPLVEGVRRGDRDAFTVLVKTHADALLRLATRLLADRSEAEDVLQESLARAHDAIVEGRFDGSNLGGWLRQIVTRQALDVLRARKRRAWLAAWFPSLGRGARSPAADEEMQLRELGQRLDRLPAEQRAALVLVAVEGLRAREAAELLGCSEGAVEQRLVRARATLRAEEER